MVLIYFILSYWYKINAQDQASEPVSMDESPLPSTDQSSDLNSESIVSPLTKVFKCAKAGDKAPPEVVKLWKENGFTRCVLFGGNICFTINSNSL